MEVLVPLTSVTFKYLKIMSFFFPFFRPQCMIEYIIISQKKKKKKVTTFGAVKHTHHKISFQVAKFLFSYGKRKVSWDICLDCMGKTRGI